MIKVFDSHHHLWHFNKDDYGWMDDSMAVLRKDYLPDDLRPALDDAGVEATVVVQARQKLEETSWLLELAEKNDFIKGVVGWVDLRSKSLAAQLERLSAHPKLVGVRHVIHDEPEDDFMLGPDFTRGIGQLSAYDLTYDLLIFPKHLKNAAALIAKFPEQRFVLDHISKPFIKSGLMEPWKKDVAELASHPNVWCKISGMVTEADTAHWHYKDFVPYMDTIVQSFGTERIMLGSDWPVCKLGGEYAEIMGIPRRYFEHFPEAERKNVYHQNCINFYQLKQ